VDRTGCAALDTGDALADRRGWFDLPAGLVYLDGNSLGPLQPAVAARVRAVVEEEWGRGLIRSWNDARWVDLPSRAAHRLAPLLGADPDEVAVADSTSVDLFKALVAARTLRPDRSVLVTDDANFPTDRYVAHGVAELVDLEVQVVRPDAVADHLDDDTAVLSLTHVDYRTGRLHDAAGLTAAAQEAGAVVVWDLAHSTGAVDVDLHAWGADLAVGCSYKFLSGGPGAPGYLYVARRWHDRVASPIPGWFGHAHPFAFADAYVPAPGAARFLAGTPPVLSLAALETALEVWEGVDPAAAAAKARSLTTLFVDLVDRRCGGEVEVVSPRDAHRRGAQVSLRHPHAYALTQALIDRGVVGDHRPPDRVRFGFAPLSVRFVDVYDAVEVLADVLDTGTWDQPRFHTRRTVT
jgi:kynureninase